MPPTGPLSSEQVNLVKNWIDQGAEWPDDLSGDKASNPPDPTAVRIMNALRNADRKMFERLLGEDSKAVNTKGPGGSTPLMYAVLYGDVDSVRQLLDRGADPNTPNDVAATALMWAIDNVDKTRLLLEHGADPNATSNESRSPLTIAVGKKGSAAVVELLLARGANKDAKVSTGGNPFRGVGGDENVLRILIEHGVDVRSFAAGLSLAIGDDCAACIDLLLKSATKPVLSSTLLSAARNPPRARTADPRILKMLLGLGADAKIAAPGLGFTPLMFAAGSEVPSVENVNLLIEHGAEINAKTADGATALDFALRQGGSTVVELLRKAGAAEGGASRQPAAKPAPAASARAALTRSVPLLQQSDVAFISRSGCVSCHTNSLTAMTVATARERGIPVDEGIAQSQLKSVASYIEANRERYLQGMPIAGGSDTAGYILLGMAAEKYPPDQATDAIARYLRSEQRPDGSWRVGGDRPPIESSEIQATATAMRALQVYGPRSHRAEYYNAIQIAAEWLIRAQPKTTEDRAFQLLGLTWAGGKRQHTRKAASDLLTLQRLDGGWAQLPSLSSDAYATGQALVALKEAHVLTPADSVYKRGAQFLINTQLEDGSWYVRSRSFPFQPYFESDFPHGADQFISAAATNWAAMALAYTIR